MSNAWMMFILQVLKERLKEMGVSVEEQITDSEKLSLLQKNNGSHSNNSPHSTDLAIGGATAGGSHGSSKRKQVHYQSTTCGHHCR